MAARSAGATTLTQQSENFGYSAMRLRRIAKLQFGIINPAELVRLLKTGGYNIIPSLCSLSLTHMFVALI